MIKAYNRIEAAFDQAREQVNIIEVATRYGVQIGRGGKALCPFHNDTRPSMSFKNNRFRCFVCDIGGDSIDLVSRLLGISPLKALKRLNSDFTLGLSLDDKKPPDRKAQEQYQRRRMLQAAFDQWEKEAFLTLSAYMRQLRLYREKYRPKTPEDNPHPLFIESLTQMETVEYWLSILTFGTYSEKLDLYSTTRGRIKEIANRERQNIGATG